MGIIIDSEERFIKKSAKEDIAESAVFMRQAVVIALGAAENEMRARGVSTVDAEPKAVPAYEQIIDQVPSSAPVEQPVVPSAPDFDVRTDPAAALANVHQVYAQQPNDEDILNQANFFGDHRDAEAA